MPNAHIHIIGAGAFGVVLRDILAQQHTTQLWGRANNYHCENGDLLILALPSQAYKEVMPHIKYNGRVLIVSKGLCNGQLLHEYVGGFLPNGDIAYLSGPNFASELANQLPTTSMVASPSSEYNQWLRTIFTQPFWRIYASTDMRGVALCGIIKNIYAIGAGIIMGRGWGHNAHASFVSRALAEMGRAVVALGGNAETALSVAGVGDLILTTGSKQSRNMQLGYAIGQGGPISASLKTINHVCEGYYATQTITHLLQHNIDNYPIIKQIHAILYENKTIELAYRELMSR